MNPILALVFKDGDPTLRYLGSFVSYTDSGTKIVPFLQTLAVWSATTSGLTVTFFDTDECHGTATRCRQQRRSQHPEPPARSLLPSC